MTIQAFKAEFGRHRDLAERAIHPLALERLREALDPETNSIAVIVKHVGGNLRSRWTDPFATDGEKPWRVRDREFVDDFADRAALLAAWEAGILPLNYARKRGFALHFTATLHYNSGGRRLRSRYRPGIVPPDFRVAKHANRRIPKLRFTKLRDIGWHVSYRDATSGMPRRHRFGMVLEADARRLYQRWLIAHLGGEALPVPTAKRPVAESGGDVLENEGVNRTVVPGSILHVATGLLNFERSRARLNGEARARGTIAGDVYRDRKTHVRDFLKFLNARHEPGIVGRMRLADLGMQDVEAFNRHLVDAGYSASQVAKRLQVVKAIIDRAGRPEHGSQLLKWNWDSRDVMHGKPPTKRDLPTLEQLQAVLKASDLRERTMVWMGIGLGFGQLDLASIRVGQIDREGYDLRRGKTAIERFGKTPPLVWAYIQAYLKENPRADGELMFVTRRGLSLVHLRGDSVQQWWHKLRKSLKESKETLGGFYILRHLGATVFGSHPGCSIAAMRRWLGHAASSRVADVYMRPVSPENRKVVEWVRKRLLSTKLD